MIKRFGEPPLTAQRYTRRPGVYAILYRDGKILATHQAEPTPEIQLPGGGIDPGEHPITALHREVFEETGWHISALRRFGTFRRFTYMPEYDLWAEKICTVYIARPVLCIAAPTEMGHTPLWLPISAAQAVLANPGDRAMMAEFAQLVSR